MTKEQIASVCHEANRAYCATHKDYSHLPWNDTPEDIRASTITGVGLQLRSPDITPEQSHQSWMDYKVANGWTYGPVKDLEAKTHPSLVPYSELPVSEQIKDHLFTAIVRMFAPYASE